MMIDDEAAGGVTETAWNKLKEEPVMNEMTKQCVGAARMVDAMVYRQGGPTPQPLRQ